MVWLFVKLNLLLLDLNMYYAREGVRGYAMLDVLRGLCCFDGTSIKKCLNEISII